MPSCWSTTICLPLFGRLGRRARCRKSLPHLTTQRGGLSSYLISLSKTRTHILNDDVLLHVFYIYQLHIRDEEEGSDGEINYMWRRQHWWFKLVHVSQQWRRIILAAPSLLDLHLVCAFEVPVADMLERFPPLPLIVFYDSSEMTIDDEEGALLALFHRDRVHRIALYMPSRHLEKLIVAMDGQFPILERLYIDSWDRHNPKLILPRTFEAPNLRHINLWRVALPIQCPLLTTTGALAFLRLGDIPVSAYFLPSYIVTRLSLLPQLETLQIHFHSPRPHRNAVDTANITRVTLPNLREFLFQGVNAYLEDLCSRMSTPVLSTFRVHFFNQLTFRVPHLLSFMQTSGNLKFHAVNVQFCWHSIFIDADTKLRRGKPALELRISCKHFDWQVSSAVQILGTLSEALSRVEQVTLTLIMDTDRLSEWDNNVHRTEWRELLRPFGNVKKLQVATGLGERLGQSLLSEEEEPPLELFPDLKELRYFGPGSTASDGDAFMPFISEREALGHPVRLARLERRWW